MFVVPVRYKYKYNYNYNYNYKYLYKYIYKYVFCTSTGDNYFFQLFIILGQDLFYEFKHLLYLDKSSEAATNTPSTRQGSAYS
jgi:hypothetical protein